MIFQLYPGLKTSYLYLARLTVPERILYGFDSWYLGSKSCSVAQFETNWWLLIASNWTVSLTAKSPMYLNRKDDSKRTQLHTELFAAKAFSNWFHKVISRRFKFWTYFFGSLWTGCIKNETIQKVRVRTTVRRNEGPDAQASQCKDCWKVHGHKSSPLIALTCSATTTSKYPPQPLHRLSLQYPGSLAYVMWLVPMFQLPFRYW